jgi:hypothetical protein
LELSRKIVGVNDFADKISRRSGGGSLVRGHTKSLFCLTAILSVERRLQGMQSDKKQQITTTTFSRTGLNESIGFGGERTIEARKLQLGID